MKRIFIYAVLILFIMLTGMAVVWRHTNNSKSIDATNSVVETHPLASLENPLISNPMTEAQYKLPDATRITTEQNQKISKLFGVTPEMTKEQVKQKVQEWYQAQGAKMASDDQHPVEFYGEILDESNQPVSGAKAHLNLSNPPNPGPDGVLEKDLQSDIDGRFVFSDAIGKVLEVRVGKDGYYTSKSNRIDFDYTEYRPNPVQPELFYIRKKGSGVDLVTSKFGISPDFEFSVPRNGSSTFVDLYNRKVGAAGQIEMSQNKPEYLQARQANEWSFQMTISDGGFIEVNNEYPFEAPESGYLPKLDFRFLKSQPNWTSDLNKDYYIKFGNPPRFGHIHLETSIGMGGVRLTYAINPDGSRNLEPK